MPATAATVLRVHIQPTYYAAPEIDTRVEVDRAGAYHFRLVLAPSNSWLVSTDVAANATADPALCEDGELSPSDIHDVQAIVAMAQRLRDDREGSYPDVDWVTVIVGKHAFQYACPMDDGHKRFDDLLSHSFVRRVEDELWRQLMQRHEQFFPKRSP